MHNSDYMGVQFVKRLRLLDDVKKQSAEVAQYFGNFDEAERIYRDLDRRDLSLQLRANIGDWFKVVQLVQQGGGDDAMLQTAWNCIGDYFLERQKLGKAAQYYARIESGDLDEFMSIIGPAQPNGEHIPSITLHSDIGCDTYTRSIPAHAGDGVHELVCECPEEEKAVAQKDAWWWKKTTEQFGS